MNRAAERASSTAIDIFIQAILAMNFQCATHTTHPHTHAHAPNGLTNQLSYY